MHLADAKLTVHSGYTSFVSMWQNSHYIAYFALFLQHKQIRTQPQHSFASLSNMTVFCSWMNQPLNDSVQSQLLTNSELLPPTGGFNL